MSSESWDLYDSYLLYLKESGIPIHLSVNGRPQCQFCGIELFQDSSPGNAWSVLINDMSMARDRYRTCPNCGRDLHEPNFGMTLDLLVSMTGCPHLYQTLCEKTEDEMATVHTGRFEIVKSGEAIELSWTSADRSQRFNSRLRHELAIYLRDRLNELLGEF